MDNIDPKQKPSPLDAILDGEGSEGDFAAHAEGARSELLALRRDNRDLRWVRNASYIALLRARDLLDRNQDTLAQDSHYREAMRLVREALEFVELLDPLFSSRLG